MWGFVSELFNSIPLVCLCVLMPLPCCLNYCSFVTDFEIRKCESSKFVFQYCFGYSESSAISYEFKSYLLFLQKKAIENCIESVDHWGKYCHHNSIKSLNPLVWSVFPLNSVQFSSVAQLCPTLCDPMNRSTPGLPVHHQLPEFTQTHVHPVSDAIQPSHPLSSPSPPAPNPSQHQGLFKWVCSLHEVAKVLEFQL